MSRLVDEIYDWAVMRDEVPSYRAVASLIEEKLRKGRTFYELEIAFREVADELRILARKFRAQASWDQGRAS